MTANRKIGLLDDWRRVLRRAWSIRFSLLAAAFTAAEVVVPLFGDVLPRGAFVLGKSHNPVQDIYLRQVAGKENKLVGVASKSLADPSRGCKL